MLWSKDYIVILWFSCFYEFDTGTNINPSALLSNSITDLTVAKGTLFNSVTMHIFPFWDIPGQVTLFNHSFAITQISYLMIKLLLVQFALFREKYSHTHTHTHIYICVYILYIYIETFSVSKTFTSVPGELPAQRPVTRSFDVFFDLRLNKRLSKQSWGWLFWTLLGPLWRHSNVLRKIDNMMTSWNEKKFRVTGHLCGNSPVTGELPSQRPVTRSFDVFFDLRINKRLSKQSWGWWFGTPSRPLWRPCNDIAKCWNANYWSTRDLVRNAHFLTWSRVISNSHFRFCNNITRLAFHIEHFHASITWWHDNNDYSVADAGILASPIFHLTLRIWSLHSAISM